jgi:lysophospholipase L1-like esterase
MGRRTWLAIAAVIGLLVGLVATPAQAATQGYVALGDSYASGVGTRTYYDDGTECYRSPKGYPSLVAASYSLILTLAACSGATTTDVTTKQALSLTSTTSYVSVTAGGNDLGFSSVLTECALPAWLSNCNGAIDKGLKVLRGPLPGRLTTMLSTVRSRAPHARIVVAGYPHIFNGQDCNAATFFSPAEESRLNAATDELNQLLRSKATAAGAKYVSVLARFSGHAVCDRTPWMNGLSSPTINSYHPNVTGHQSYATMVGPVLTGRAAPAVRADGARSPSSVTLPKITSTGGPFTFDPPHRDSTPGGPGRR